MQLGYNFCLLGLNWNTCNTEISIFVTIWGFRWLLVSMKSLLIHVLFFIFQDFVGSMILLWGCQNKGDQWKDEYAFFKDSSSILKANMLIFNLSILFSANKFTHFGYYDLQSSGIQSLYSAWNLSLRNHSCYIPSESCRHQEAKYHLSFCVASNDTVLWIAIKLTAYTLVEL